MAGTKSKSPYEVKKSGHVITLISRVQPLYEPRPAA